MKKYPFSILVEDMEASKASNRGIASFSPDRCPFYMAFIRQFPEYKGRVIVLINEVLPKESNNIIANLREGFGEVQFYNLKDRGTEHHTTIVFNE